MLAASGQEALDLLNADNKFDLIITDMQMPFMDGITLAKSVRNDYPGIPIILLSSVGDEYHKDNPLLFHSILTKPIKQHVLSRHIISGLQKEQTLSSETTIRGSLSGNFNETFPLQILVAEDNLFNQQVILHILLKMGYTPDLVENGLETVEAIKDKVYDIILNGHANARNGRTGSNKSNPKNRALSTHYHSAHRQCNAGG